MPSHHKKTLLRILLSINGSCGCGGPKPTDVFDPEPEPEPRPGPKHRGPNPCSMTPSTTATSGDRNCGHSDDGELTSWMTASEAETTENEGRTLLAAMRSPIGESVAVEKESEDPYKDFRHSMLQMIFEKEMCSQSELEELLDAFLQLNSPRHHGVILKAFAEICRDAFPPHANKKKVVVVKKEMSCYGHVRGHPLARA